MREAEGEVAELPVVELLGEEPVVVTEPVAVESPTPPPIVVAVPEPVAPVVAPVEPVVVTEPVLVESPTLPPVVAVPEPEPDVIIIQIV